MEVIICANETFDLASGSHFPLNTIRIPSIYFGGIWRQKAEVRHSHLLYLPSRDNSLRLPANAVLEFVSFFFPAFLM